MNEPKTRTVVQYEVRSRIMPDALIVETVEQVKRFAEAATEFGGVRVRRRTVTVTETKWEAFEIDQS
ncbi:hypothetical protein SEA_TINALIN_58 [Gordonia phage TinaLin]|uniref:Uncharacterized protein n=1 Tax=Gordonia phage TinaLin TaxID=2797324 RepID=A0A7T7GTH1_9CAUD|nr:hypothetical protein KDJ60_gp48 [Gordonia phage TinaLin]QQM15146.1 hypothetical protein SEA_TINALIN_58 [Gordonia phage TinaLin]